MTRPGARAATADRHLMPLSVLRRRTAAGSPASCGRPTRVTGTDWSARSWAGQRQSGYQRRSGGLDSGTSARRVGRLEGGDAGVATEALPAGDGAADDDAPSSTSCPMLRRVIGSRDQGPAHRRRPRAGDPGARDGGPFAGRAGQAASLRGGHGAQPRGVDGREERPGPQPLAPAGGHRGGRVPGHRRAAPGGAGDGRRRAGPAAGGRPGRPAGARGRRPGHHHAGRRVRAPRPAPSRRG